MGWPQSSEIEMKFYAAILSLRCNYPHYLPETQAKIKAMLPKVDVKFQ